MQSTGLGNQSVSVKPPSKHSQHNDLRKVNQFLTNFFSSLKILKPKDLKPWTFLDPALYAYLIQGIAY